MFRIVLFILFSHVSLMSQESSDSITYSIDLDDFVVTAQYEPTHYKEATHRINIIKKERINRLGAVTLEQALTLSPSIRLSEDPILGTSIRMRGVSSSNVAILIDGIPMIGRNNGSIDLSQVSLQNVERIEIVEGPLSNLYGNNAAGGVINIITKKSQLKSLSFKYSSQVESIGQGNHTAAVGYQKDKFNAGIHARFFRYNQYNSDSLRIVDKETLTDGSVITTTRYPFNPKDQKSIGSYLRYNINEDNHIVAKYDYNVESVSDFGIIKRPQFNPYGNDQFYETSRNDLSINYSGKPSKLLFVDLTTSLNNYDRIRDDKRYYLESMTFDSLLQMSDTINFRQIFGRANVTYTGLKDWTFGGGYTYTKESGKGDRLIDRTNTDSLFTSFTESAIYSEIKYNGLKRLQLSLGKRFIYHNVYENAFTFSFQSKFNINKKLTLRSSYAQGYRSPSLKELYLEFIDINHNIIGNPNLKPERSYDVQSTLSYVSSKLLELSINGYYTNISDRINLTEYETLKFRYDNISSYRVFGIQPSIQWSVLGFELNSSISLGYWSTNIDLEDAPQFGQVLDLNNQINYALGELKINFLLNHRYIGALPIYRLQSNEIQIGQVDGYHLVDFSFSTSFWKNRISITPGIRNVLDTRTVQVSSGTGAAHSGGRSNNVSIGRSYFVSVDISFE